MPPSLFEWLFIGVLAILIVVSVIRRGSSAKARTAALQGMGFVETPSSQVFGQPRTLACLMFDRAISSISTWTAVGRSAIGDTVIFDFTHDLASGNRRGACTVVGFRVPAALPDFEIRHVLLLERALNLADDGDVQPPATLARFDRAQHAWVRPDLHIPILKRLAIEDHPAFAKSYRVWAADAAGVRRVLTPSALDALTVLDDGNLHVMKRLEWLLIFRWTSTTTRPERYPGLVQEAVALAQHLDLRPPVPASGPAAGTDQ